jgi:xanthine dehydrogenase molybdopterin-binding subunit B
MKCWLLTVVAGLGFVTSEDVQINEKTGELISNGTWEYKPPLAKNIPANFNVELLRNAHFSRGILSSKASGEPPLVLATSLVAVCRFPLSTS